MAEIKTEIDGKKDKYLLYYDGESVTGKVSTITMLLPHCKFLKAIKYYATSNFRIFLISPTFVIANRMIPGV